jgi:hypothetical protein
MRMGPAEIADYQLRAAELPKGSVYLDRPNLLSPNPKLHEDEGKWEAIVDPSETRLTVYRLETEAAAEALEKSLKAERQALKAPARFESVRRGAVVATIEQQKAGDAVFNALADLLRAKLRLKR